MFYKAGEMGDVVVGIFKNTVYHVLQSSSEGVDYHSHLIRDAQKRPSHLPKVTQ